MFVLDVKFKEWKDIVAKLGMKPFAASQIIKWIYQKGVLDPSQMTNLPSLGRQKLADAFSFDLPKFAAVKNSADGSTKIALELFDKDVIEAVLIPDDRKERLTVCLSSQVGCALGCRFCRTGEMNFKRDLTVGEITSQLFHIKRLSKSPITNIVFMGMGEPLLNPDNVMAAIEFITNENAMNFARRRITVSTAGVVPNMADFFTKTGVKMAVSLNAATHETRAKIMPIENKYPLPSILETCKAYSKKTRFRITFEYVMLKGVNDSKNELNELAKILGNISAKVNLIPFNPYPNCPFAPSDDQTIKFWLEELHKKGIQTNIRKSRGQDIGGACGQLASENPSL